ncbi:MAG: hypothetical protein WBM44_26490 [Waterburya sp.]
MLLVPDVSNLLAAVPSLTRIPERARGLCGRTFGQSCLSAGR